MKKNSTTAIRSLSFVSLLLFLSVAVLGQRGYQIKADPLNKARKVVEIDPATRKATEVLSLRNVLDADIEKRNPIAFKPFEMRNPRTNKPLNPDATITINMADGSKKVTTVKKFFEDLNNFEKALNQKGRSLRMPNAFAGLRPVFNASAYKKTVNAPTGFTTRKFELFSKPAANKYNKSMPANTMLFFKPQPDMKNTIKMVDWQAQLFIGSRTGDLGTPEFPVEWVKSSLSGKGRTKYPLLIQMPKGLENLAAKVIWQVSDMPFDGTLKDVNPPGVKGSGVVYPSSWNIPRGADGLPDYMNYKYSVLYVDLAAIAPEPVNQVKQYFIRLVICNKNGDVLKMSDQVIANYGSTEMKMKIAPSQYNSVPDFNYSFPQDNSMPFGMYVKGGGFNSAKITEYVDEDYKVLVTKGYRVSAGASLGIKYFNFMSLVDGAEPMNKDFELINAKFKAIAGNGTAPGGQNETPGVSLNIAALNGSVNTPVTFTDKLPGSSAVSLNYTVKQKLDMGLVDLRFFIGPVPIRIAAGISGEAGLEMSGYADLDKKEMSGTIRPYLSSAFNASGGVDAVIAYATLNAEVNPLLSIDMPMTFSSTADKPITFKNTISGLSGRIYLKAGFYYPCPSLEKIVGFLSGDEDLPLCECNWEYNIFDFNGFSVEFDY